jgi:ribosome recycling factor
MSRVSLRAAGAALLGRQGLLAQAGAVAPTKTAFALAPARLFSRTAPALKKRVREATPAPSRGGGSKHHSQSSSSSNDSSSSSSSSSKHPDPDPENPLDLSDVTSRWAEADAHFRDQLTKHTSRGRFSPDALGRVPVKITTPAPPEVVAEAQAQAAAAAAAFGKKAAAQAAQRAANPNGQPLTVVQEFPLAQLAQVVEGKGRQVVIIANEPAFVKPIMSAVQNNPDYNQQPQRGDTDLELVMRVELTLPEDAARQIGDTVERWRVRVRDARARRDKAVKAWKADRILTPDAARKVEKALQMAQDRKMDEIKRFEDDVLRKIRATQL